MSSTLNKLEDAWRDEMYNQRMWRVGRTNELDGYATEAEVERYHRRYQKAQAQRIELEEEAGAKGASRVELSRAQESGRIRGMNDAARDISSKGWADTSLDDRAYRQTREQRPSNDNRPGQRGGGPRGGGPRGGGGTVLNGLAVISIVVMVAGEIRDEEEARKQAVKDAKYIERWFEGLGYDVERHGALLRIQRGRVALNSSFSGYVTPDEDYPDRRYYISAAVDARGNVRATIRPLGPMVQAEEVDRYVIAGREASDAGIVLALADPADIPGSLPSQTTPARSNETSRTPSGNKPTMA